MQQGSEEDRSENVLWWRQICQVIVVGATTKLQYHSKYKGIDET